LRYRIEAERFDRWPYEDDSIEIWEGPPPAALRVRPDRWL